MKRREFLSTTLAVAAAGLAPRSARASNGLVEVLLDEPIGTIAPELHGHFTEHIGEVVYNGIWVGENSKIPNVGGIRKALVDHMRQLHAPVIRWPGAALPTATIGATAWARAPQRPVRTNFWDNDPQLCKAPDGPQKYDPNTFGTAEFMRFCQLCGAQALRGRQRPQPHAARFRRMGGVLQFARGQHHAGPNARRRRQPRTLQRDLLGHRQ